MNEYFKKNKAVILFLIFVVYAISISLKEFLTLSSTLVISTQYLVALILLVITGILLFMNRKIFLIAFLLLLVASTFILEFHPYTNSVSTFGVNGISIFKGKPISLIFLLAFVLMHFKELRSFLRQSKLWN